MTGRVTDRDWLLGVLSDGREHSLAELLSRSIEERGCGLTVHSRVSELRQPEHGGHVIEHSHVAGRERGHAHTYQLVSRVEPQLLSSPDVGSAACGSTDETPSSQPTTTGEPDPLVSHQGLVGVGYVDGDGQLALVAPENGAYRRAA